MYIVVHVSTHISRGISFDAKPLPAAERDYICLEGGASSSWLHEGCLQRANTISSEKY